MTAQTHKEKILGIIGGMGSEAASDLFSKIIKLTPVKKDQDHIHIIIDNYPQIPDRTDFIFGKGEDPKEYLLRSAKFLEKSGADALLMACNTAHYFLPILMKEVKIPFISIIESAVNELKSSLPFAKNIAVLSTTGTKKSKIYDNALLQNGYNVLEISQDIQEEIMSAVYDGVKKGQTENFVDMFQKTIDKISDTLKPDVFICACTEIPILMNFIVPKIEVIDATSALAKAAVKFAKN
ncbi:MAG: amino acid racemase [Elusimicrobiota bacterium]|jgi:aspartate racemase|nr:amino acid racemase [Elusimicrobiota bacterium]